MSEEDFEIYIFQILWCKTFEMETLEKYFENLNWIPAVISGI